MADLSVSKGPREDSDWFSSNGTLAQVGSALQAAQGAGSMSAIDRLMSLVKIIGSFMSGGG